MASGSSSLPDREAPTMEQHGPSCPQRHEQQALTAHQLIQRALNTINELDQLGALKLEEATVCRSVLVVARARLLRKSTYGRRGRIEFRKALALALASAKGASARVSSPGRRVNVQPEPGSTP